MRKARVAVEEASEDVLDEQTGSLILEKRNIEHEILQAQNLIAQHQGRLAGIESSIAEHRNERASRDTRGRGNS